MLLSVPATKQSDGLKIIVYGFDGLLAHVGEQYCTSMLAMVVGTKQAV